MSITKYWGKNTPPPPLKEKIGKYYVKSELHEPTNYSYIYLCKNLNNNVKNVIKFVKCKINEINKIQNEIEIMSLAKHPNILELEDYFLYNEYMCIVTPFMPSKSLHTFLIEHYCQGIPEDISSCIIYQLLDALNYLHKKNILHRDIKTENILVVDPNPKHLKVKLADFGSSIHLPKGHECDEFIGTPDFSAPEIFQHINYTEKVDIWSLGITLFVMLTGFLPFPSYSRNPHECKFSIINGDLNYQMLYNFDISNDAIDLIMKMCAVDPASRITAEKALKHPWIVSQRSNENVKYSPEGQAVDFNI